MCGIVGFIDSVSGPNVERLRASLIGMVNTLEHRGPDDDGQWIDGEVGVAIGHRRLAIVDLSSLGRQPMISESGRFVITYNGEIYNFRELRAELEPLGHRFRGHSDTEVILAAIEEWGLTAALERFVGMFSFGLWDKRERVLHLARDRLGEKPLYYGWINNVLLFGSELKALRAHPQWRGDIDYDVLKLFLRFGYVPAPKVTSTTSVGVRHFLMWRRLSRNSGTLVFDFRLLSLPMDSTLSAHTDRHRVNQVASILGT